jgi:hypothetical protein
MPNRDKLRFGTLLAFSHPFIKHHALNRTSQRGSHAKRNTAFGVNSVLIQVMRSIPVAYLFMIL